LHQQQDHANGSSGKKAGHPKEPIPQEEQRN
jgi:hypothetical protein